VIRRAGGTSHIVTLDADGMAVSLTTTINTYFGSQVMIPEVFPPPSPPIIHH
jgi:gamma-glutamyltranspeptidase/glutathione hydrolase